MRKAEITVLILVFFSTFLFGTQSATAQIYKYQDENGVWHYTDNPMEIPEALRNQETMGDGAPADLSGADGFDLEKLLMEKLKPRNGIEKASLCTVVVTSAYGKGTGFFISNHGHIITNKHVIQATVDQDADNDRRIESYERQFADIERKLDAEEKDLEYAQQRVFSLRERARNERDPALRKYYEEDYNRMKNKYDRWEKDFNRRKEMFREQKSKFAYEKSNFIYKQNLAKLDNHYQIRLADGREMYVSLMAASSTSDLALLKLARYRTPRLTPTPLHRPPQGLPVYAVGNPVNLSHSAAAGIISGYQEGFIKTDAKIYPGNSGGPLVTQDGAVVGINTFKQITHKYEGLGFAIPIHDALNEFSGYLQ